MPELPDLHVFCINLKKQLLGKSIVSADVTNSRQVTVPPEAFARGVAGSKMDDIVRIGKELYFHLSNGNVFSVHLMLNGNFSLCPKAQLGAVRDKIVSLSFEDGRALAASDFQGRCKVTWNPPASAVPDVMAPEFTPEYFAGAVQRGARKNVKEFLIDQKILKGIGNAYVDEILWKANISPESTVGKIPADAVAVLYSAIGAVMTDAIDNILRIKPDIISGEERSFLRVHNHRRSTTEDGEPILVKDIANKKTYYTKKQVLYI